MHVRVLWGYCNTTVTEATVHAIAAEYPLSTVNGTLTCSSLSGTELYETCIAGQEESGCVHYYRYKGCKCQQYELKGNKPLTALKLIALLYTQLTFTSFWYDHIHIFVCRKGKFMLCFCFLFSLSMVNSTKKKKKMQEMYTVCPRKNGSRGISSHILKCVCPLFNFIFDLICLTPWAVCVRKSFESIKQSWRCGFERGHK